jgi:dephospho-CoA kinase
MLVIGLTGSIGMGKSTIAARLREHGIAVFDADAHVHELYAGTAVAAIEAAFPGTTAGGEVDRQKLAEVLLGDPDHLGRLESIVHPLVAAAERTFLKREAARGAAMAVLEVPLLFETGGDRGVDVVVVASAPAELQRARVRARLGMTDAKLEHILSRQTSDADKRARADFIVDTAGTIAASRAQVDRILESLHGREGTAFAKYWA